MLWCGSMTITVVQKYLPFSTLSSIINISWLFQPLFKHFSSHSTLWVSTKSYFSEVKRNIFYKRASVLYFDYHETTAELLPFFILVAVTTAVIPTPLETTSVYLTSSKSIKLSILSLPNPTTRYVSQIFFTRTSRIIFH